MFKAVGPKVSFPISPAVVADNLFFSTNVPVDVQLALAGSLMTVD